MECEDPSDAGWTYCAAEADVPSFAVAVNVEITLNETPAVFYLDDVHLDVIEPDQGESLQ